MPPARKKERPPLRPRPKTGHRRNEHRRKGLLSHEEPLSQAPPFPAIFSDGTACPPNGRHDRTPSRGQSRKPVRPSGMTKPSTWRAFLRPAGHRLPETSCAGRAPHGLSQPPDMPNRDRSTPYRPPCTASAFPDKAFPSRSIPPAFQTGQPLPAAPGLP